MFIYNIKLNSKNIVKLGFVIISIIITIFFIISIYKIFSESFRVRDEIKKTDVAYIESQDYTNILKSVYENLDDYIGQTICFTGYIHRNSDFEENQFVLARDMQTSHYNETLIVGFLCSYKDAKKYENGTWVKITGKIKKGHYHGDIPILDIENITPVDIPEDTLVCPPDNTYVPTAIIY